MRKSLAKIRDKIISWNMIFLMIVWTMVTVTVTYLLLNRLWEISIFVFALWVYLFLKIANISRKNVRKVAFMLDAVGNADYNFKYATDEGSTEDRLVNRYLNRITQILTQARDEAKHREKYYEIILDSVNTGIIVVDEKGNIYQSNSEALRLLGLSVLTHVAQLARVDGQLQQVVQTIRPGEKQQVTFNNGTSVVNLSVRASIAKLHDSLLRIIALNDIHTELEEKELDSWIRLTRVLTHEIMNSVTPITSLSDTLLDGDYAVNDEVRHGLEVISSTGRGLIDFVENYRKFTHIPSPKPTLFYVSDFLERMKSMAEHQPEATNIRITIDEVLSKPAHGIESDEESLLMLYSDENLISRVVTNLLKNALQAIGPDSEDGEVHLRAWCDESEAVYIEVSNNGPLIPVGEQEHIFVPFYTTRSGGNGIGLSLSRQIMRVCGGTLTLNSDASRHLTIFTMKFP